MKDHFLIMARIVILFIFAILLTFVPEQYQTFFGDFACNGRAYIGNSVTGFKEIGCQYVSIEHSPGIHWGYRHWLWFAMGCCIFLYNTVLIIISINKKIDN